MLGGILPKPREVVGMVQDSRMSLGGRKTRPRFWSEVGARERRKLKVDEVRVLEEERRMAEAAQQGQQGRWLNWNGVEKLELTWSSIWERSQGSLKNLMLMAYDVYPSPANLVRWNLSRGAHCNLCGMYASLQHILVACPVALAKGWYTCRHNRVLEVVIKALHLAEIPERRLWLRNS